MAIGHISYDRGTNHGAALHNALNDLENGRDNLLKEITTFIQMKDGDDLTVYAVEQYGFPDLATAELALAELESVKGQLDGIVAALNQAFSKFRNG